MPVIDDRPFEVGAYTLRPWGADDIAWVAVFLCSDHARNISGQCVPVTAGEPS